MLDGTTWGMRHNNIANLKLIPPSASYRFLTRIQSLNLTVGSTYIHGQGGDRNHALKCFLFLCNVWPIPNIAWRSTDLFLRSVTNRKASRLISHPTLSTPHPPQKYKKVLYLGGYLEYPQQYSLCHVRPMLKMSRKSIHPFSGMFLYVTNKPTFVRTNDRI